MNSKEKQGREDLWFPTPRQERAFMGMLVGMAAVVILIVVGLALVYR